MASIQAVTALPVAEPSHAARFAEKYFYQGMSLLIAGVVVYGFSNTIDRKLVHAHPRPPILLWVHAFVFSSWVVFFILQSALVRIRKVKLHRTMGWLGAALAATMVVLGFWVAPVMARFDTIQLHRPNRDAFLIVPLLDILAFAIFLGLAILWRKKPERHRRLMLIGSCVLTGAAFGRMPLMHAPLQFYGGIDGLILLGVLRDLWVSRRVHTVYLIALPLLVATQAITTHIFLHSTAFWIRIAHSLIS
jgi:hypothetical protein